jgi:glycosyltransferase involved in cell wall biosynthesis
MHSFSLIIPLHNEALIVKNQILSSLQIYNKKKSVSYEILLIENGSTDQTAREIKNLQSLYPNIIRIIHLPSPSYGQAIRRGIQEARYPFIIQCDVDFIEKEFIMKALPLLKIHDIVIGSKLHPESHDERPFIRKLISRIINTILFFTFAHTLTDTHGIKAYNKKAILPLLEKLHDFDHFMDTELILRAYFSRLYIIEIPISIKEVRNSRFSFGMRSWRLFKELYQLISYRNEIKTGN